MAKGSIGASTQLRSAKAAGVRFKKRDMVKIWRFVRLKKQLDAVAHQVVDFLPRLKKRSAS